MPNEGQTEDGEPSHREIMNQLEKGFRIQSNQLTIAVVAFAVAIAFAALAVPDFFLPLRLFFCGIGLVIFVIAFFHYIRRVR